MRVSRVRHASMRTHARKHNAITNESHSVKEHQCGVGVNGGRVWVRVYVGCAYARMRDKHTVT